MKMKIELFVYKDFNIAPKQVRCCKKKQVNVYDQQNSALPSKKTVPSEKMKGTDCVFFQGAALRKISAAVRFRFPFHLQIQPGALQKVHPPPARSLPGPRCKT